MKRTSGEHRVVWFLLRLCVYVLNWHHPLEATLKDGADFFIIATRWSEAKHNDFRSRSMPRCWNLHHRLRKAMSPKNWIYFSFGAVQTLKAVGGNFRARLTSKHLAGLHICICFEAFFPGIVPSSLLQIEARGQGHMQIMWFDAIIPKCISEIWCPKRCRIVDVQIFNRCALETLRPPLRWYSMTKSCTLIPWTDQFW